MELPLPRRVRCALLRQAKRRLELTPSASQWMTLAELPRQAVESAVEMSAVAVAAEAVG